MSHQLIFLNDVFSDELVIAEIERGLHSLAVEPLHDHSDVMREANELLKTKL